MADDEKCVQVGSFIWKWHESVGWYDADEDDPTFGNEGVLLDEIVRLRAALAIASGMISTMPQYEHEHPESIMEMLVGEARRG